MFNKAIILALLVGGLGVAVAGCEGEFLGVHMIPGHKKETTEPKTEAVKPKTEAVKPKTEAVKPKTETVISRGYNKPQTRAEELEQYCANRKEKFITAYVEVLGQRFTCKQYLSFRAQEWSATETTTATEGPGKTFSAEEIIRLKNAGVSNEVILQLLQSGRGNLP